MGDRTDHAAWAVNLLADTVGEPVTKAQVIVEAAGVHATLALVEQQRIANLIAIAESDKIGRVTAEQFASEAIHLLKGERRGD